MEEVDKILIHSLRQAGTSVPPEVQSVRDLTPELVVAAAVRCLRAVSPALGNALSPALPPGISARFRLASELAAACQELGFGGDVGYQTFLYSSEHDVRRLLLFLVEKLPRDEGHRGAETPGNSMGGAPQVVTCPPKCPRVPQDAKRDEVVRKAYKYLAALHENCAQLIRTIEDTGTIQREIRDLEEQIEVEGSSKLPASLERILSDCRALREENAQLAARVRHA
ncbi:coiled-coil domain-containing protein 22 [Ammospiza maritima maritima]